MFYFSPTPSCWLLSHPPLEVFLPFCLFIFLSRSFSLTPPSRPSFFLFSQFFPTVRFQKVRFRRFLSLPFSSTFPSLFSSRWEFCPLFFGFIDFSLQFPSLPKLFLCPPRSSFPPFRPFRLSRILLDSLFHPSMNHSLSRMLLQSSFLPPILLCAPRLLYNPREIFPFPTSPFCHFSLIPTIFSQTQVFYSVFLIGQQSIVLQLS